MNTTSLALLLTLASCGSSVGVHAAGHVEGTRTFRFKNSVALIVESTSGSFEWREHDVRDGAGLRARYSELRLQLRSGGFVADDRNLGKGRLRINGAIHAGSALRLCDNGAIEETFLADAAVRTR